MTRRLAGLGLAAAGVALGCIGVPPPVTPSKPVVEFPPREALAAIAATPAPVPHVASGEVPPEGWTVEPDPTAPADADPWQPQGAFEQAFADLEGAAAHKLRLSRALSCVARELGRYYLDKKAAPPDGLLRFMQAACGAFVPEVGFLSYGGEVPTRVSDEQLLDHWRAELGNHLVGHVPAAATEAGFWFGRAHGRAAGMTVYATPRARLAPLVLEPDAAGNITIAGELDGPADTIYGYANHGRYGIERCSIDPSVARPRFRATCPVAADDATAWIQLFFAPPRRVLATPFVQVLARRAAAGPLVYREESYGEPRPVATPEAFSQAVLAGLNAVRAEAKVPPVRLSPEESAAGTRVAGHYFAAVLETKNGEEMDRIALGLMAGWQVAGMIRDGRFVSSVAPRTHDAGRWLTTTLAMPMGRATLLAPGVEEIALGPVLLSDPDGLAAVVTGWELHHGTDHADDVARLYARLAEARQHLAKQPAGRLREMGPLMRTELDRVAGGQIQPSQALQAMLARGVDRTGHAMRGYVIETTSLDALQIPEAVVNQGRLDIEIGVTHFKPKGAAWAQFVILVVYIDWTAGTLQEARARPVARRGG